MGNHHEKPPFGEYDICFFSPSTKQANLTIKTGNSNVDGIYSWKYEDFPIWLSYDSCFFSRKRPPCR